ncbi:hypothetical protein NIES592_17315 [Fischerella major NIES-592]|uniref:Uncharacterized protein n=3 Tax=Fischerella TaxID=1190 RepID=A0A2N6LAA5_9CYAN|nr:hypothetical protein NIES592_17315 [Fischerella major NIES-592]PMB19373.1 hypothetical protein CEN46_18705 [Fischerella thermalis CCMEE 5318]PMB45917.1 hypothetical protein CEN41_07155 [Fischerella thermalis CCMEE 5330]
MTTLKSCVSACRYCRHYTPVGQRGGTCNLLNVAVKSGWKACPLSIPSFAPSWESIDTIHSFNSKH